MPVNGYFDTVFGASGTLVAVPDAVQSNGSVSYASGWGVAYTLPSSNPSYRYMPQGQFNQIFYDITSAIQNYQQNCYPPFITTTMNGGTPYSYSKFNTCYLGGVVYISNTNSNTDTPPSSKWNVFPLGQYDFWCGTSGGSANAQTLTTGFSFSTLPVGAKFAFIAGYTNTNTCGITIDTASSENAYQNSSSGPALIGANGIILGNVYTATWDGTNLIVNATSSNSFVSIHQQSFTTSGTYTPTAGMVYCIVEEVGGGGGGAGTNTAQGGGGGGGEYARGIFSASTIGASQVVTIGAAGSGGASGNNNGGSGGTTSLGSLLTAVGGGAGTYAGAGGTGGTGGTGTGIHIQGQNGQTVNPGSVALSGAGGSSKFGFGALASASAGASGNGYGAGGSGAESSGSAAGGAGTAGYILITEYCNQ